MRSRSAWPLALRSARMLLYGAGILAAVSPVLVLALAGGERSVALDRIAFEVSADRLQYVYDLIPPRPPRVPGPSVSARIRLTNESDEELALNFLSSQRFDFLLEDEHGRIVFRWSEDKVFLPVLGREIVRPGESLVYEVTFSLPGSDRGILPAGRYMLRGILVSETPFSGSLPVTIVHAH